jgi:hypothetical protein
MAVHGPHGLVGIGNAFAHRANQCRIAFRHGIAHGIGEIDGGRAFSDHTFEHPAKEVHVRAAAVLRRKLDVVSERARERHGETRLLVHLIRRHAELFLHVQRRRRDKRVDAERVGGLQRLGGAGNILVVGASQRADRGVFHHLGDRADRLEIAVGACRKAGFDHIDLQALELTRNADLFLAGHGGARRLFAVTQGGIENDQFVRHL